MPFRALIAVLVITIPHSVAAAATPLCKDRGTDDTARDVPHEYDDFTKRLFDTHSYEKVVYRCFEDSVLMCVTNNGFDCIKPDTRKHILGVSDFCRRNWNEKLVPIIASGHSSAYGWQCQNGQPKIKDKISLDQRGFRSDTWINVRGID